MNLTGARQRLRVSDGTLPRRVYYGRKVGQPPELVTWRRLVVPVQDAVQESVMHLVVRQLLDPGGRT
jgi:hypothetical protein